MFLFLKNNFVCRVRSALDVNHLNAAPVTPYL